MTAMPEVVRLHPVPHPSPMVRQAGFPLDHAYLERCWTPVIGPSSVLFLRHCAMAWRDQIPAEIRTEDLSRQLGLGRGTSRSSPIWHTIGRIVQFRFAAMADAGEIDVYTEAPAVPSRQLERLPTWARHQHDELLGQHLDGLVRQAGQAPASMDAPPHVRMNQHLDRLTNQAALRAPTITR